MADAVYVFPGFSCFWSSKAAETARDMNKAFGPRTIKEPTANWNFTKFRSGDAS